jgi:hypothetical protein
MGYRFVLRRLKCLRAVKAGQMMTVHMRWFNAGTPVYRDYILVIKFVAATNTTIVPLTVDFKKWLPGDAVFDGPLHVPDRLTPSAYRLRLALLDARTRRPAIRLAIRAATEDGWYDLGEINIE